MKDMRLPAHAIVALAFMAVPAFAQEQSRATVLNLNVAGEAVALPDMATINLGVRSEASTAQAAMAANAEAMTALMRALRRAGLPEGDIQTSHVSLYPDRDGDRIVRYRAANSVRVLVRDIDDVGPVIDRAVTAGAVTLNGVWLGLQDPEAQLQHARMDAVSSARERADVYARALGMRVEHIISVTEAGAAAPSFSEEIVVTGRRVGNAPVTPIAPGELTTRVNVSVAFQLR
ncbi:MAG: SIMPL domain-containing protein [Hyphomonadaceae bacterium]|nr:SIMPL domain-containing protein [Hyphomonadaceae bacterium]